MAAKVLAVDEARGLVTLLMRGDTGACRGEGRARRRESGRPPETDGARMASKAGVAIPRPWALMMSRLVPSAIAALFCMTAVLVLPGMLLAAQDTTGTGRIAGRVTSGEEPAAFVTVCLVGTTRCDLSAEDGRFQITDVRAGEYRLEIAPPGQPAITSDPIDVHAGLTREVDIRIPRLDAVQESVTVTAAALQAPAEVKTSSFLIDAATVSRAAGTLQDVTRFVQTLPGVAIGSDDFRNDIIVRGGSPLENLFIVDNIEVPNINSFATFASAGGTVSMLDAGVLRDVTFLTGGYPASYTNRASSVMQVAQREGDRERFRGRATLGFAGSGAILEGPLGPGKRGSWIVSARRSFLDVFTDDIGFGGVPVLYSLNAKAVYDIDDRNRLWAVGVGGLDRIRLGRTQNSGVDEEIFNLDIRYRGRRSATGFNWQRLYRNGVGLLGVTHSYASLSTTVRDLVRNGRQPPDANVDEVIASSPLTYTEDSGEHETTVKYDFTRTVRLGTFQTGLAVKVFRVAYAVNQPFGTDSPYAQTPGLNPIARQLAEVSPQFGGYAQLTATLGPRISTTTGARVDHYGFLSETRVSPRASARYAFTSRLSANVAYGEYYQQPPFLYLAAFSDNRALEPFQATHWVGGLSYTWPSRTRVGVEVYRKNYEDYPVARDFPELSLANVGDTFNISEVLFPLVSAGRGRAHGIEFVAEKADGGRWWGQANAAWSRARHAGLDGLLRSGSFDYRMVINATAGLRLTQRWELGARLSVLGGRPFTPFDQERSRDQRRGVYDLTQVNAVRGPAYVRLDLRVDRRLTVRGSDVLVFLGVQNVLNRENFAGQVWNTYFNQATTNTQLGAFPLIGMEWRF
ncbi:MAG: TonB-dependent receptor [Vicinamibacterales bacterium]